METKCMSRQVSTATLNMAIVSGLFISTISSRCFLLVSLFIEKDEHLGGHLAEPLVDADSISAPT